MRVIYFHNICFRVFLLNLPVVLLGYELTIVHNNDVHAHYDQTNVNSGDCSKEQAEAGQCYGGEARRITVIKNARANIPNTIVLDAGDRYVGTLWFTTYRGTASAHFVNKEAYDAMCLGNHEFDFGVEGLLPFIDNLTVPVVDANIDISREPRLQGKILSSLVLVRGGEKIGIVGYITTDTSFIALPGPTLKFPSEIGAVRSEVEKLKADGVRIIIGLSHSGYTMDQRVAAEVDGLDIIVGGHSHSFLYTGQNPSTEEIEGPYPTVVQGPSGKNVLIVQAYAWGKYMGMLNVTFDENMDVESWQGNPILLDNTIHQDNETLADILEMVKPLEKTRSVKVGSSAVKLEGERSICRTRECNTGNLLTDAMVWYHVAKKQSNDTWGLASIALLNGGGIRATTLPGNISLGQVLTVQPFGNTVDLISIKGVHLRGAFEHSVFTYDPADPPGRFFQVSGIRVKYDLSRKPGSRVVYLEALCLKCEIPTYSSVQDGETYKVLMNSYIINGGDDYKIIRNNAFDKVLLNSLDADVTSGYLTNHALVFPAEEGRIQFVKPESPIIVHRCPDTVIGDNSAYVGEPNVGMLFLCVIYVCTYILTMPRFHF